MSIESTRSDDFESTNIQLIIDRLRRVPSYVDLKNLNRSDSNYPINMKDLEFMKEVIEYYDLHLSFHPIGIFNIGTVHTTDESKRDPKLVGYVTVGTTDIDDDTLLMQIDDLPITLAYKVRTVDDLEAFLEVYNLNGITENMNNNNDTDDESSESSNLMQYAAFDLRRNSEFRPIMMERYMMFSRFVQPYIYGPYCNPETISSYLVSENSFNLGIQYFDIMKQNEGMFCVSAKSRFSNSTITIKFSGGGVIAEVAYKPISIDLVLVPFIEEYNKQNNCDIPLDMPIDVVLFLSPLHPWQAKHLLDDIVKKGVVPKPHVISVLDSILDMGLKLFQNTNKKQDPIMTYIDIYKRLFELCISGMNVEKSLELDENSNELTDVETSLEMIRVNITECYVQIFKNGFKSDDLNLDRSIRKICQMMKKDGNLKYISESYVQYALSTFFEMINDIDYSMDE